MQMNLPVDFERLTEFRLLVAELKAASKDGTDKQVQAVAVFLWLRAWVDLSYLARQGKAGVMTAAGARLFEQSVDELFGDDARPMALLEKCGLFKPLAGGGWHCELFAAQNAHLGADFQSRESKGAARSAVERGRKVAIGITDQQLMLLESEIFSTPEGPMESTDRRRCVMLIVTLDRLLKRVPARVTSEYRVALVRDAHAVVCRYAQSTLDDFYTWLQLKREHASVPKTTEQVLADFDNLVRMSRA